MRSANGHVQRFHIERRSSCQQMWSNPFSHPLTCCIGGSLASAARDWRCLLCSGVVAAYPSGLSAGMARVIRCRLRCPLQAPRFEFDTSANTYGPIVFRVACCDMHQLAS